jgi:hypothetical protein
MNGDKVPPALKMESRRSAMPSPGKGWPMPRLAGPALIVAAAAVAVTPQLIRGNSCGHDFDVHLVSWLDCVNAWRHGILYPHWTSSANYGAGEPRFVFYPPLTWMAGAALALFLTWPLAPIALTFLIFAGTGLATRALAREWLEEAPSTLAGCTAIFSGFALFTAYERAAFPEFMGGVLLPLLMLFALRQRPKLRVLDGSTAPLAIVLAAAWLSNAPLGVIASYLLAGLALLAALTRRSWVPLLRAALAVILGLFPIAVYWIPAKLEQRWVDIRQATEDPGYNFENNWAFARHANPVLALHDQVLRQASWIAISMIAVAVTALAICWLRRALPAEQTSGWRSWIPLAAIPFIVLFLLFPISRPVWNALPEFRFLQYPWRWLEAVEAPMAVFFAAAVWPRARLPRMGVTAACAALFLAATGYAATAFFQVCYPEDTVSGVLAAYRTGAGFEGMYEYEPPGADLTRIPTGLPGACLVEDANTVLALQTDPSSNPQWDSSPGVCIAIYNLSERDSEHRTLQAQIPDTGYLVLRLLSFPAWHVRVNGRTVSSLPHRDDGLVVIPVPRGPVQINVDWTTTPDVRLSRWISLLGVLALTAVGVLERKPSSAQVS